MSRAEAQGTQGFEKSRPRLASLALRLCASRGDSVVARTRRYLDSRLYVTKNSAFPFSVLNSSGRFCPVRS